MQKEQVANATQTVMSTLESWYQTFLQNIPNIAIALAVLVASVFISRFVSKWVKKLMEKRVDKVSVANIIGKATAILVVAAGLFIALGVLNLNETLKSLLTGAGIAGIVIGLALQGTLSNTIAGIALSFKKRIKIGNWVETNGYAGEVIDINLREFTIKEADNNIVIIPNKTILDNPLKNYSMTTKMRVMVECGVGYESDLEHVEQLTKETIAKTFNQVGGASEVEFFYTEFGNSSINYLCRFWIDAESALQKLISKSKAIIEIKKAYDKEGINIPFPIRTLQMDSRVRVESFERENAFSDN